MNLTPKQIVETYGLHHNKRDGILWLLQQNEALNALGLPEKQCPFRLKSNLLLCPHKFDFNVSKDSYRRDLDLVDALIDKSKILRFFDPASVPDTKTLYIETDNIKDYQAITLMQAMLSPSVNSNNPAHMIKDNMEQVVRRLRASNLGTYFIFGMEMKHQTLMSDIATTAAMSGGRLVLAGPRLPYIDMSHIMTRVPFDPSLANTVRELGQEALRSVGALRLKKHMRV